MPNVTKADAVALVSYTDLVLKKEKKITYIACFLFCEFFSSFCAVLVRI